MASRQLDLAILFLPVEHPGIAVEPLAWVDSVCAVPASHPLSTREQIGPADLAGERLIVLSKSDPARFPIEHVFRQARVTPMIRYETPSVTMAVHLAARGSGVGIVNGLMAREAADASVALIPFRPAIRHQLALIRPADFPESVECAAFASILREEVRHRAAAPA